MFEAGVLLCFFIVSFKRCYDKYLLWYLFTFCWTLTFWWDFSLAKRNCKSLSVCIARVCVCVHPLNKDVSQAIIALFSVPFSKDGRMGRFRGFSLLFVEVYNRLKCDGQCLFLCYCDWSCYACEKSFLTIQERNVSGRESAHCRSPRQKIYIISVI